METREFICQRLRCIGVQLDAATNRAIKSQEALITTKGGKTSVYVIPTNEELQVAIESLQCLRTTKEAQ